MAVTTGSNTPGNGGGAGANYYLNQGTLIVTVNPAATPLGSNGGAGGTPSAGGAGGAGQAGAAYFSGGGVTSP